MAIAFNIKQKAHKLYNKLYVIQDLNTSELDSFSKELYDVSQHFFGNMSFTEFEHYVTRSGAKKTYIMCYYNSSYEMVGFFALHLFAVNINNKEQLVFRAQTGLKPEYRRSKANMYFSLFIIIKYRLLYPFKSIYCFLAVISPSMYAVLAKTLNVVEPKIDRKTKPETLSLIRKLREIFEFPEDESKSIWTSNVGCNTIATEEEKRYWQHSENPHIQYYQKLNPKYYTGIGLVTLIPFSWKNIVASSINVLQYIFKKKLKRKKLS